MSQQIIDISTPDDGLGDVLRTGFDKTNQNFTELYNGKVDKVAGKGLSENDFTDADKAKLDGIEAGAQVNVQADWGETDPSADSFIQNKPPSLYASVGHFHYADLATQTTPLSVVAGVPKKLTNDTLGAFTEIDFAPYGVPSVWDETLNSFIFSFLDLGDTALLRVDLSVTTSSVNQRIDLYIKFGVGTASEYDLLIDSFIVKSVVTDMHIMKDVSFSIDNEDWQNAEAEVYLLSDDSGSVKVNGWYVPIVRKSVNVVDFNSDPLKQDKLTETNFGAFMDVDLATKLTPSPNDTILGRDFLTNEAVEINYPIVEGYFNGTNFYLESGFVNLITATTGRTYIDLNTNLQYRWSGTAYVQISAGLTIPDLQRYSIYAWRPLANGWYGFSTPTTVGTADNQTPLFTGNDFIKAVRRRYVSATTAGSSVEFYEQSFRQTSIGDGFFFSMKFGNEDAVAVADARLFAGFAGLSVIGNVNPSTQSNIIGIGADSGDTNLSFMHNDSTGTAVKVNLGASFPANTIATDLYCLQMYNVPSSTSIWYRVINISTKAETAWSEITTELPAVNQILLPHCWRNNGTTALAVRLSLVDLTLYKRI